MKSNECCTSSLNMHHLGTLKPFSPKSAINAYFSIYAHRAWLNIAIQYFIGSCSMAIYGRGDPTNSLIAPFS